MSIHTNGLTFPVKSKDYHYLKKKKTEHDDMVSYNRN